MSQRNGTFVLFVNNDAFVTKHALAAMLATCEVCSCAYIYI